MRNTDLQQVLFPVGFKDIFYKSSGMVEKAAVSIPKFKAVVNLQTGDTLGIVSGGYRLITNEEAMRFARKAFSQLFGSIDTSEMEVFNVFSPKTGTYCHIDLIHKNYHVNIFKQEVYLPYIRVTNSYNKSRALRFDLGFVRKLCNNGVIFEQETIKYKFPHTKQAVKEEIVFDDDAQKLKRLETEFANYMQGLDSFAVPPDFALPLICQALELDFKITEENERRRLVELERLAAFKTYAGQLVSKYYAELGENAYAVFNAITEYASAPGEENNVGQRINGLQTRAGKWVKDFANVIRNSQSLEEYVMDKMHLFRNGASSV